MSFYQKEAESDPISPLIQESYEAKIKAFMDGRKQKCLEKILEDAEVYVDSIIISEINIKLLDTLIFPEKPLRPIFPTQIVLDDTTKIEPLLKDETIN